MLPICRSSTLITSNRRAMPVEAFSAQSLRVSASRARSRAAARLTRARRFDPGRARASRGAGEVVRLGLGEVAQGLLLDHLGAGGQPRVLRAGGGQLPALLQVGGSAGAARTPVPVLLDREVPHVPGVRAVVLQRCLLGGRGEQPIPGHAKILANTTDVSGEVKRRFLPGLKAGVSTPRS